MKISYQWLNEWVELSLLKNRHPLGKSGAAALGDLLTARGLEVEGVHSLSEGLDKVVTVRILERSKHPEADRLSLCKVSLGSGEPLEIVCGAQNMKAGDIVALAQMGATLPNGLKIEKSKIRGVVSHGMLCSEAELGLKAESEGILILPPATPIGWKLADVLGLDDTILEVKLTANRGDCLSHRGMAREMAAALGTSVKHPKISELSFSNCPIQIQLNAGEAAPQFFGCWIEGVQVGPSPDWLKKRLESIGQRSINNLVDVSNYLMFELGFPVHIYDADQLEGGLIQVRKSEPGEKMMLLDGGMIETTGEELVIADGKKPVGLAGVMGGGNSEVTDRTRRVFLECAEFDPTRVRRAAFRFGRRSEASLRFEKGIDPAGLREAIARLADLVVKVCSDSKNTPEIKGATFAQLPSRTAQAGGGATARAITTSTVYLNQFLGTQIEQEKMVQILRQLECRVEAGQSGELQVVPPSYRLDLKIREDLAEEIARSVGYDAIPSTIPPLTGMPMPKLGNPISHRLKTIQKLKRSLSESGLHEVVNYAFQSEAWLNKFGMQSAVKVLNPISEEQGSLVPSLLPGLMGTYLQNQRHHFGSEPLAVRLFEVRPVFQKLGEIRAKEASPLGGEMGTGVEEKWKIAFLISGPRYRQALQQELGAVDFFDLKGLVEALFEELGTKGIRSRAADSALLGALAPLFHSGQSMQMAAGKEPIGFFGRIHPKLEHQLKLRHPVYWGELSLDPVIALTPERERSFQGWSSFPTIERDFALLVDQSVSAEQLTQAALKFGKPIAKVVKIFDTYKGAQLPDQKVSVGVRVIFGEDNKSLEEKQVEEVSQLIVRKWAEEFGAALR